MHVVEYQDADYNVDEKNDHTYFKTINENSFYIIHYNIRNIDP